MVALPHAEGVTQQSPGSRPRSPCRSVSSASIRGYIPAVILKRLHHEARTTDGQDHRAFYDVDNEPGYGFLESVYENSMIYLRTAAILRGCSSWSASNARHAPTRNRATGLRCAAGGGGSSPCTTCGARRRCGSRGRDSGGRSGGRAPLRGGRSRCRGW